MTDRQCPTRRQVLRQLTLLPVVALPALSGCGAGTARCNDPSTLSRGEEQMRKTREYVETSSNSNETCSNCQFFSHADDAGCGQCEIFGGSVSRQGYCTSWAGV